MFSIQQDKKNTGEQANQTASRNADSYQQEATKNQDGPVIPMEMDNADAVAIVPPILPAPCANNI